MKTAALLALAAAVAILPALSTVSATAGDGLAITGLPGDVSANGTAATLPFQVVVTLGQNSCATSQGTIAISLTAALNGTAGTATAQINPRTASIQMGATDTLTGSHTYTQDFTLTVTSNGQASSVPVQVKATATPPSCPVPTTQAQFSDTSSNVQVRFTPLSNGTSDGGNEQPVPGVGLPALVLVVGAVALVLRRKD